METENPLVYSDTPSELVKELLRKKLAQKGRLLELSCGSGADSLYFASKKFKVTGIDKSAIMINYAKHKDLKKRCRFQKMEGLPLQFSSRSFDLVLDKSLFAGLDNKDHEQYIREVYRVLNVNGVLILIMQGKETEKFDIKNILQKNKLSEKEIKGIFGKHFELQEMLEQPQEDLISKCFILRKK